MTKQQAIVYLIGAGPGDIGLLTIKGAEAIRSADVVVYDRLSSSAVLDMVRDDAELVYVGKAPGRHSKTQDEINAILIEHGLQGKIVARVKGGDPFVFGRGGEEAQALLSHKIPFVVIPGVTSAVSVPAYAGIPVTHRDICASFHVITGNKKDDIENLDFATYAKLKGTLVFLMGVGNLAYITARLIECGKDPKTPIALVHRGTTCKQRLAVGTLDTIVDVVAREGITSPSVIVIGDVVNLHQELAWLEAKPLSGKRIAVTRSRAQASGLKAKLEALGAEVYQFPLIKIVAGEEVLAKAVENPGQALVFTSQNAVELYFAALQSHKKDIRSLAHCQICAVGAKTAESLEKLGIFCDLVPEKFTGQELAKLICDQVDQNTSIQLLRSDIAAKETPQILRDGGFNVEDLPIYKTVMDGRGAEDFVRMDEEGEIDFVTFTSSSTVKNYLQATDNHCPKAKVVCIGDVTAKTAESLGLAVDAIAEPFTIDGMIEKIIELSK